jgi:hypothetical protein
MRLVKRISLKTSRNITEITRTSANFKHINYSLKYQLLLATVNIQSQLNSAYFKPNYRVRKILWYF